MDPALSPPMEFKNSSYNDSLWTNSTLDDYYKSLEAARFHDFERYVRVLIPIVFGLIVILGLVGNLLVIVVIVMNRQMRSTTNILIFSLAVADLLFIVFCVPFTAAGYAFPKWPFGVIWCKIVQYMIYVCAYASVYTLVVMSFDRYLAVVHPISSMDYRTQSYTILIVLILWVIILGAHVPLLLDHIVYDYDYFGENRSACINGKVAQDLKKAKLFYGCFFMFGYVTPLSAICVLYGFMLKRLLYGVVPGGSQRAESIRSKKRVTKMVVIIVLIFALCWLPIQIVFMIQYFGGYHQVYEIPTIAIQMAANCLAYMNSCVNPILYAFLSDNFRRSFRKILCCGSVQYTKFEYERTNVQNREAKEKTYTQASTNTNVTSLQTFYKNGETTNKNGNGNEAVNHCTHTEV